MKVKVSAPVYPTEDANKICEALSRLFNTHFESEGSQIFAEFESDLEAVSENITVKKIQKTIAKILEKNHNGSSTYFLINKQAACIGKINFIEEKRALGEVKVEIFGDISDIEQELLGFSTL